MQQGSENRSRASSTQRKAFRWIVCSVGSSWSEQLASDAGRSQFPWEGRSLICRSTRRCRQIGVRKQVGVSTGSCILGAHPALTPRSGRPGARGPVRDSLQTGRSSQSGRGSHSDRASLLPLRRSRTDWPGQPVDCATRATVTALRAPSPTCEPLAPSVGALRPVV